MEEHEETEEDAANYTEDSSQHDDHHYSTVRPTPNTANPHSASNSDLNANVKCHKVSTVNTSSGKVVNITKVNTAMRATAAQGKSVIQDDFYHFIIFL